MKYRFHPDAELEFDNAIAYYEQSSPGLGLEFASEVFDAIQRILDFPKAWQILEQDIRRCLTGRFPFGIIYYQRNGEIVILAVMQLNRKPDYWKSRK